MKNYEICSILLINISAEKFPWEKKDLFTYVSPVQFYIIYKGTNTYNSLRGNNA